MEPSYCAAVIARMVSGSQNVVVALGDATARGSKSIWDAAMSVTVQDGIGPMLTLGQIVTLSEVDVSLVVALRLDTGQGDNNV